MLLVPSVPEFNFVTGNVITSRIANTYGTTITPGNNSYGSYTEIVSDSLVTKDCYRMLININNIASNTLAKDAIVTIGIDTSGGTTYADFINHLLCACATGYTSGGGGHYYDFPVYIPAGTAIAAKGSVNNATVGTMGICIWLYGDPTDPCSLKVGQGVETIGAVAASSRGTSVTPGGASDGTWTSLGTTSKNCFAWNLGVGINNNTMASTSYAADLSYGDGTNQKDIIRDQWYVTGTAETMTSRPHPHMYCSVPNGGTIYGRMQCAGSPDSGISMAAYGVY